MSEYILKITNAQGAEKMHWFSDYPEVTWMGDVVRISGQSDEGEDMHIFISVRSNQSVELRQEIE